MVTGVELIAAERKEQLGKHGYDANHDDAHIQGELIDAARYCLTKDPKHWPGTWDLAHKDRLDGKDALGLAVAAGALIAAEIDRRQRFWAAKRQEEGRCQWEMDKGIYITDCGNSMDVGAILGRGGNNAPIYYCMFCGCEIEGGGITHKEVKRG